MLRYEIFIKKHLAAIVAAACIVLSIALAVAYPHTDIEVHHTEVAHYE